jgi:hypothetical protein
MSLSMALFRFALLSAKDKLKKTYTTVKCGIEVLNPTWRKHVKHSRKHWRLVIRKYMGNVKGFNVADGTDGRKYLINAVTRIVAVIDHGNIKWIEN